MKKHQVLHPLTALGFFDFNILNELISDNRSAPVHCIEYALRNIADRVPVRIGGGKIKWYELKHLISASAEEEWTDEIRDWYEFDDPYFFKGVGNIWVLLAQGAFGYSQPLGIKERRQMEARSKVLKYLLDGAKFDSPRFKSALKGLVILPPSERKILNAGFYRRFAEMRMMEGDHFDESYDSPNSGDSTYEGHDLDAVILSERGRKIKSREPAFHPDDEPHFHELHAIHDNLLILINEFKKGGRGSKRLLDEINLGEEMISGIGMDSHIFTREKERLSSIRDEEWGDCRGL